MRPLSYTLGLLCIVVLCQVSVAENPSLNLLMKSYNRLTNKTPPKNKNKMQKNAMGGRSGPLQLYKDLLKNYSANIRPVSKDAYNITVYLGVSIAEITGLNDQSGKLSYQLMLRMLWNDPQLRWNPQEYGGVSRMYVATDQIWAPDIDLYNGVDSEIRKDVKAAVYPNGDVLWMPPAKFESTCRHEFRSDSWHCPMAFRSWTLPAEELDIVPMQGETAMSMDELSHSAHWVVLNARGEKLMKTYPCCEEPFSTMEYLLKVRNKIGHPALLGKRSVNYRYYPDL